MFNLNEEIKKFHSKDKTVKTSSAVKRMKKFKPAAREAKIHAELAKLGYAAAFTTGVSPEKMISILKNARKREAAEASAKAL